MVLSIPKPAARIIAALEQQGYAAYVVGGCVRDSLLGLKPADWDICTSARPEQVLACFSGWPRHTGGLKHGTVTLLYRHQPYEVTSFRRDGEYSDQRRPDQVEFVTSLREDLSRRDFTINALAWHPGQGLIDYFGGTADLEAQLLRAVGAAKLRVEEDALRIMRALRFAATLGFSIETATALALHQQKEALRHIAIERIQAELLRLLPGPRAAAVLAEFSDVLAVFLPEILPMIGCEQHNPYHHLDVWQHTLAALEAAPPDVTLRLTMLLHDIGKPACLSRGEDGVSHFYGHARLGAELSGEILRRLRCENVLRRATRELVLYHDIPLPPREKLLKRWLNRLGETQLRRLLAVRRADTLAHHPHCQGERLRQLQQTTRLLDKLLAEGACFSLRDLALDGRDLLALGLKPGPPLGKLLQSLLSAVIDGELPNQKEALLEAASQRIEQ